MRYLTSLLAVLLLSTTAFSQSSSEPQKAKVRTSNSFRISPPIKTLTPRVHKKAPKKKEVKNYFSGVDYKNKANALPTGPDPIAQGVHGAKALRSPLVQWDGITSATNPSPASPPDPTGAVGPNHYVEAVNQAFQVWDKSGNSLYGPVTLSTLWTNSTNDGDPIVMYDQHADRWFISQFQISTNTLLMAISTTPDPLGSYYQYSFTVPEFPDYPKYSVWHDGYYLTLNTIGGGENAVVFERDAMLTGNPSAQMQIMTIPDMPGSGIGVLPSDADGSLPPTGTPNYLMYFNDDAWGEYAGDHLRIWEYSVDWVTPANTTLSSPYTVSVTAFNSEFQPWGSGDIEQPGTGQKLDCIPIAMMYRLQWRDFGTHQSLVANHTVDVNGNDHAGIRWYELRKTTGNFSLYQEGTYAPDSEHRFMGSVALDSYGNMALAYSVSSSTTYPSQRYTGRYANDPLGQMTFTEQVIVDGLSSQTTMNRWGDYSQLQVDPVEAKKFWFVGEYMGNNSWRTHISSFQIASPDSIDLATTGITNPTGGQMSATEGITVNVLNPGMTDAASYVLSYSVNGGAVVNENISTMLTAGSSTSYTFTQTADMSTPGAYDIMVYVTMIGDTAHYNDTVRTTVNHPFPNDVGVVGLNSPIGASQLSNAETVDITIQNFGTMAATSFPVSFTVDGGAANTETFTASIPVGGSATYTFTATADLSIAGTHNLKLYTEMSADQDLTNDTLSTSVQHMPCSFYSDCSFGDGFENFTFGTINNNSGCGPSGYEDFTTLSTPAAIGLTHTISVESGYADQYMSMWIDYNDNNNFEVSEMVITDYIFDYNGSTTFDIPANANQGLHRLRIRANWTQSSADPCMDFAYGETEDYMVNVYDDVSVATNLALSPELQVYVNEDQQISLTLLGVNGPASVSVVDLLGQVVLRTNLMVEANGTQEVLETNDLSAGTYYVMVHNHFLNLTEKILLTK